MRKAFISLLLLAAASAWGQKIDPDQLNISFTVLPIGAPLTTAALAAACNGTTPGMMALPAGTVSSAALVTVPSNCQIVGVGKEQTILGVSNASPIAAALDINGGTNIGFSGFTILCASSPATCTTAVRIRFSTNITLKDMVISGGGYGAGSNPLAQVYTENVDNLLADNVHLINAGGKYDWVNGYNGTASTRLHLHNVVEENNAAIIAISLFNCQFCTVDGGTSINENNQTDSSTVDGYGLLFYASNVTPAITTCTGSGTVICTIALSGGGTTQIPVGASFRVATYGISGGTGTLNGTWDATLASPTTFTITGAGNTSGATYGEAFAFFPTTNNLINDVHIKNTAGSGIYLQGCDYCTVTGYDLQNVDQQMLGSSLPAGGIAIGGGNPISVGVPAHGDSIGHGIINGVGQYCLDIADTVDFVASGLSCNNAAVAGVRLFAGSFNNTNFEIGGLTIDNVPTCVKSQTSSVNTGSISGTCQNFSASGLQPSSGGISFRNWKLIASSYIPCIDDFFDRNGWFDVSCSGGYDLFAGSNTKVANLRVASVTAGANHHAVEFAGATHVVLNEPIIDTANDGIFFAAGSVQNSDITILHPRIANITSQPAIWDQAPATLTITTHTSTSVDIAATGALITAGMGLGDYGTGGNNDIPPSTTITTNPGSCASGCTVTISSAATGSHAAETGLLQNVMSSNVRIWDADIQGNLGSCPTTSQAILAFGLQSSELRRTSVGCFGGQGIIDVRGASNGVTISGGTLTGGTAALAGIYMPGGLLGSAANVTVSNLTINGTVTNSIYDHGAGLGNIFNDVTNFLNGNTVSVSNTNTTIQGTLLVSLTPAATASSACVEQTFTAILGLQTGQGVSVTAPSALSHVGISGARVSAANALTVNFCGDLTGGTAPAGNYKVIAQ